MTPDRVHWWQVYATVKWAVICALQASAHLSGSTRSVELAAIGRRVCESEWDLFTLLGVAPGDARPRAGRQAAGPVPPFGRPTAAELVEAVREYLEAHVMERSEGGARFEARVARNALAIVERELRLGPALAAAHADAAAPTSASPTTPRWRRPSGPGDFDDGLGAGGPGAGGVGARPAAGGEPVLLAGGHRVGGRRRRRSAPRRAAPCRRRPSRSTRLPMPWRRRPASQAAADHEDPGVVEGGDGGRAGGGAEDGHQAGHAEGDRRSGGSWRRARSRWRSAAGGSGAVAAPPSEGSMSPTPKPLEEAAREVGARPVRGRRRRG